MGSSSSVIRRNMKVLGLLLLVGSVYCVIPSCTTVWEDKCWDEPRQKCNTVQVPHQVTSHEEKCTTESDPEEKCEKVPEEKCEDKYEEECHTEYEQECHTKYSKECKTEYEDECHMKYEEVCDTTTETKTEYVTKNKCELEQ